MRMVQIVVRLGLRCPALTCSPPSPAWKRWWYVNAVIDPTYGEAKLASRGTCGCVTGAAWLWREVVYLWRTSKLPRNFFEVSQIWLYRGGTACAICLRASLVERHDNACYSYEHCASAAHVVQATRTGFS